MQYTEYIFSFSPLSSDAEDLLSAMLGECGFESFVSVDGVLKGYVQSAFVDNDSVMDVVKTVSSMMDAHIDVDAHEVQSANWNATWESEGFKPIVIDSRLVVHSTDHTDVPHCDYDIKINPCMAFGTGSHATTRMLLTWLLEHDVDGKRMIDAGCGTGILGILAMLRNAGSLLAYDIDEWSSENALKNFALNGVVGEVRLGDSVVIEGEQCDLLVANINRNILVGDMERFAACIVPGGTLLLSGFYKEDATVLISTAKEFSLDIVDGNHVSQDACMQAQVDDMANEWCWLQFCRLG